jgi:hypothetical protein
MTESDPAVGLREDIEKCIERLEPKDRELLRGMSEGELIRLHMGYGMWLRNQFRHNKLPHLSAFCYAKVPPESLSFDALSEVAIREIWLHVRSGVGLKLTHSR